MIERSCLICHRRKVRCDKQSPCSSCVKSHIPCRYAVRADTAVRKPHKTTILDVSGRLAQLEKALSSFTNPIPENDSSLFPKETPIDEPVAPAEGEGLLTQEGSSGHYYKDAFLSRVLEEAKEIRTVLGQLVDRTVPSHSPSPSVSIGNILGTPRAEEGDKFAQLNRSQATQLWQIYTTNFDPLAKILHIPTAQVTVFTALNDPTKTDDQVNLLLFSIYYAAMTTCTEADAENILGLSKATALANFKQGLEKSIILANVLETPTLQSLQALAIYILSLRIHSASRSVWILNGIAMRAAQSIGLHRDGRHFKLPPFECELRRRLWAYISVADGRVSEDHSIAISSYDPFAEIELPLHVNDNDIWPEMTELPAPQSRFCEMTIPLLNMVSSRALLRMYPNLQPKSNSRLGEASRKAMIQSMSNEIDKYLANCNSNVPLQRLAILLGSLLVRKIDFITRQQLLGPANQAQNPSIATEESLEAACDILERNCTLQQDELLARYFWLLRAYPQYNTQLYVLWHLCVKPSGPNVERAWAAVNATFELERSGSRYAPNTPGSKWAILEALRTRALRVRTSLDNDMAAVPMLPSDQQVPYGVDIGSLEDFIPWHDESFDMLEWNMMFNDMDSQPFSA